MLLKHVFNNELSPVAENSQIHDQRTQEDGNLNLGFPYYHVSDIRPISRKEWIYIRHDLLRQKHWQGLAFRDLDNNEGEAAAYQLYRTCCGPDKTGRDFEYYIASVLSSDRWDMCLSRKTVVATRSRGDDVSIEIDGGIDCFGARDTPQGREHVFVQTKCWHPTQPSSKISRARCYEFSGIIRDMPDSADPIGIQEQSDWFTASMSASPTRTGYFISTCKISERYKKIIQGHDQVSHALDCENLIDWLTERHWSITGLYKSTLGRIYINKTQIRKNIAAMRSVCDEKIVPHLSLLQEKAAD